MMKFQKNLPSRQIVHRCAVFVLALIGIQLLLVSNSYAAGPYDVDPTAWIWGVCRIFYLTQGPWGGLVTTITGICTIVAASTGNYKYAYAFLAVAIGCFILEAIISLWFGTFSCDYDFAYTDGTGYVEPPEPTPPTP